MNLIPAFAFSAWSGTGKTTIIEQLIPRLKSRGLRIAVIKHDAHDFEIDKEGKDSWRFARAGADVTVISSKNKTARIEQRPLDLSAVLSGIRDVDIILIEGYNQEVSAIARDITDLTDIWQEDVAGFRFYIIGVSRRETGKGFRLPLENYCALVTDETVDTDLPVYSPDDIEGLTDFLLKYIS